jgi:hypothetical protein
MILDLHSQAFISRIERRPFRHRPRFEHAIHLETEVVMQPRGAVSLYDKTMAFALGEFGRRLGCIRKAPLALILFEGHRNILKKAEERSRRAGKV